MRLSRGLKELDLIEMDGSFPLIKNLRILMEGDTPLERFKLSYINDAHCQALIHALPNAHSIKELTIGNYRRNSVSKERLLHAFEKNSSLVQVQVGDPEDEDDYFNADDLAKIRFYTNRNEHLSRLLKAPIGEVPLSLHPRLLYIAKRCQTGPSLILQSLLLLNDSVGQEDWKMSCKRRGVA